MDRLLKFLRRWGNAGVVANVGHDLAVDRERLLAAALLGQRLAPSGEPGATGVEGPLARAA